MKSTYFLLITSLSLVASSSIAQAVKEIQLERYQQTVPAGKVWFINNQKSFKATFSDGVSISGTACNAAFHSNPSFVSGIVYNHPDLSTAPQLIAFTFKDIHSLDDRVFSIKPYFFLENGINDNDLRRSLTWKYQFKEIVLYPGTKVWLTQCVTKLILNERSISSSEETTWREMSGVQKSAQPEIEIQESKPAVIGEKKPNYLVEAENFSEGISRVASIIKGDNKYGYLNMNGEFVVTPKYAKAYSFSNGLALVSENENYDYTFINKAGQAMFNTYAQARSFVGGFAAVMSFDASWAFIDRNGKIITTTKYQEVGDFKEGLAKIKFQNKWGFIDTTGKEVIYPQFTEVRDFSNGLALVRQALNLRGDSEYKYIDTAGKIAFTLQPKDRPLISYESSTRPIVANPFLCDFINDQVLIEADRRTGYAGFFGPAVADKTGKLIIKQKTIGEIYPETEGMFLVKSYGKYGYLNSRGKWVIANQYQDAGRFYEGLARVKMNDNWGYIDKTGNIVINKNILKTKSEIQTSAPFDDAFDFKEGVALVKVRGKYGVIDKNGNWIVQPVLEKAVQFRDGIAAVKFSNRIGWNYINKEGKILFESFR